MIIVLYKKDLVKTVRNYLKGNIAELNASYLK